MRFADNSVARSVLRRHALTLLWLILMLATGVSLFSSASERLSPNSATAVIMLLAYFKARLVMLHFMRVCDAPTAWRIILELWLLAAIGQIVIYATLS